MAGIEQNESNVLPRPTQMPDLKPIEHVTGRSYCRQNWMFNTRMQLFELLYAEWIAFG